jgi:hypothetical protein
VGGGLTVTFTELEFASHPFSVTTAQYVRVIADPVELLRLTLIEVDTLATRIGVPLFSVYQYSFTDPD